MPHLSSSARERCRRRRGQSAVETLIVLPIVVLVLVAMTQLWSLTWAAQNAHLRAREGLLHGRTYLGSRGSDVTGMNVFGFTGRNYEVARSRNFYVVSTAQDTTLAGVNDRGRRVRARAVLRSR